MKNVIFVILFLALFLGCHESNSVEPILDNSAQLNRLDNIADDGTLGLPDKGGNSEVVEFVCNYNFNPDKNCGKVLNGKSLKYTIDNEAKGKLVTRYLYDVKVSAPSVMVINNKPQTTLNVYTINRVEKVTKGGKIISGETWGTFKIHQIGGHKPAILFQGEFTGKIKFNTTNLELIGKGVIGIYLGRDMLASEQKVCTASGGKLHCWTSNMEGSILPRVTIDD